MHKVLYKRAKLLAELQQELIGSNSGERDGTESAPRPIQSIGCIVHPSVGCTL